MPLSVKEVVVLVCPGNVTLLKVTVDVFMVIPLVLLFDQVTLGLTFVNVTILQLLM